MKARVSREQAEQQLTEAVGAAARRAAVRGVALGAKTIALSALERYTPAIQAAEDYESLRTAADDLVAYLRQSAGGLK